MTAVSSSGVTRSTTFAVASALDLTVLVTGNPRLSTSNKHKVYDSFGNILSEKDFDASGATVSHADPIAIEVLFGYTIDLD